MKTIDKPQMQYSIAIASAEGVVERWTATAKDCFGYARITPLLEALKPEERTIEAIDKIIGNNSWTTPWCSSCHEARSPVAVFGSDFKQYACIDCMTDALRALRRQDAIDPKPPVIAP